MYRRFSHLWLLSIVAITMLGCSDGRRQANASRVEEARDAAEGQPIVTPVVYQPAKEGWGHFKGRFTMAGAPKPGKVDVNKDEAYCGKFMLVDESLLVGKTGGLANVIVMVNVKRGDPGPKVHESYAANAKATITLDNFECRFVPRVVLLRTSQTLEVKNSDPDPIAHNAKIEADPPINPIIAPGGSIKAQFDSGRLPATVSCSIHPWMIGRIVVRESPYMAVTDANGDFVIENLPSGEWQFQVYHERLGYVDEVNIGGEAATWDRGVVTVPISGDETTDWGEVKLDYAKYKN
jgi:hypothetical protein